LKNLSIVKIGGHVIDDPSALYPFLENFSALEGLKILVHGGGRLATDLQEKLGVPVYMEYGRRVTDEDTLKIVTMVYAGLINKTIVAQLQALNCNAIGLSGADANCISAVKRENGEVDYGFAGDITKINNEVLEGLLENDLVPVFSAITHNNAGQLLNTNADTIASALAMALSKSYITHLVYCFEKNGVLRDAKDESSVIHELNKKKYEEFKKKKYITDGMIPKMENAFAALAAGVQFVHVGSASRLINLVKEDNYEGTRIQH